MESTESFDDILTKAASECFDNTPTSVCNSNQTIYQQQYVPNYQPPAIEQFLSNIRHQEYQIYDLLIREINELKSKITDMDKRLRKIEEKRETELPEIKIPIVLQLNQQTDKRQLNQETAKRQLNQETAKIQLGQGIGSKGIRMEDQKKKKTK